MKYLKYWFPVVLYCCIIFGVSAIPAKNLPSTFPISDKVEHAIEYGILAVLVARAVKHSWGSDKLMVVWFLAVLFVALYGITDEFHQSFVTGRSTDVTDWLADIIGGAVGAAIYLFWKSKTTFNNAVRS